MIDEEFDLGATKEKFLNVGYDEQVYANPTLTKELKFLIDKSNDDFPYDLFFKAKSIGVLDFWFSQYASLPATAICACHEKLFGCI